MTSARATVPRKDQTSLNSVLPSPGDLCAAFAVGLVNLHRQFAKLLSVEVEFPGYGRRFSLRAASDENTHYSTKNRRRTAKFFSITTGTPLRN